nr:hypothetical protein [Microbacterium barkeri]
MNDTAPATRLGDRIRIPRTRARIGVARRDITPPVGIRAKNWGPADWERSEGAHRPFALTALAVIASDERPRVLLAVDGTWWRRVADEQGVRGAILDGLGLEPDQLMLSLSHTHAGAVLCAADAHLPGGELIPAYLEALAAAGIAAGREALETARPGLIEWTTGSCTLAAERELDLDGRALVGFNPQGTADGTVTIGRISLDGDVRATLVNYACHPTTLAWQNREVSPDYVGAMREIVEAATGAPCLFVQGASGELAPREQYTGDVAVADRHGRSLGHAVAGGGADAGRRRRVGGTARDVDRSSGGRRRRCSRDRVRGRTAAARPAHPGRARRGVEGHRPAVARGASRACPQPP